MEGQVQLLILILLQQISSPCERGKLMGFTFLCELIAIEASLCPQDYSMDQTEGKNFPMQSFLWRNIL